MELVSLCPLQAWGFVWQSQDGRHAQTVVVKATFKLAPSKVVLAEEQDPAVEDDRYWNDDPNRSLLTPSDKAPYKPRADVMLVVVIGGAGWLWGGVVGAIAFRLLHDLLAAWTPQYWTFWLGLFLVVLVMVGRDRFVRPWTWFKR